MAHNTRSDWEESYSEEFVSACHIPRRAISRLLVYSPKCHIALRVLAFDLSQRFPSVPSRRLFAFFSCFSSNILLLASSNTVASQLFDTLRCQLSWRPSESEALPPYHTFPSSRTPSPTWFNRAPRRPRAKETPPVPPAPSLAPKFCPLTGLPIAEVSCSISSVYLPTTHDAKGNPHPKIFCTKFGKLTSSSSTSFLHLTRPLQAISSATSAPLPARAKPTLAPPAEN